MRRPTRLMYVFVLSAIALGLGAPAWAASFKEARIYIEYNSSANDLGFHVSLDAEDWETLQIVNPNGITIFNIVVPSPPNVGYTNLGLTELFFEGAEPKINNLSVLANLIVRFPFGEYTFSGTTTKGQALQSTATLSHCVPAGPSNISAQVNNGTVTITWDAVTSEASLPGLSVGCVDIVGYQVIVDTFQVTLEGTQVTLPPEFVQSLGNGPHAGEVLAIDAGGAQTITEFSFHTP